MSIVEQPPEAAASIETLIVEQLVSVGVSLAAYLPDNWVVPLIEQVKGDSRIDAVAVAREPEIVGICAGAYLGGRRAVGIMGATGFLTCISELSTLGRRFQLPMFLFVSNRGGPYEPTVHHETQWRVARPVADAIGLMSIVLDRREKLSQLGRAYESLRLHKRPCVAWITKSLLDDTASWE
ncbi:MAG TPA: hypothetical protein VFJ77_03225 [Gaiellaceae bacterium]|nr:hypothetical protein [Gaiellaceae bacterium]